ncbi:MAG: DUF11 domain-containing protein [Verrucomicrobia bacterium]|nr:DUF11 domain-containing protein [Verrucomicrobiota bacterium]
MGTALIVTTGDHELVAQITNQGATEVTQIQGSARFASANNVWQPLQVGDSLTAGAVVQTTADSLVDLRLEGQDSNPADKEGKCHHEKKDLYAALRLHENTFLALDKLASGSDGNIPVTDTQLDLRTGVLFAIFKPLSVQSKFEVKVPNGVVGVRQGGGHLMITAEGDVAILGGTAVAVYATDQGGQITVIVPDGQMFDQGTGTLTPLPKEVRKEMEREARQLLTKILSPRVTIKNNTADKRLLVNRTASYSIVVKNTGKVPLTGVVVTDTAAAETVIVEAVGGSVNGGIATWNLAEISAGDSRMLTVKISSREPGSFCNTANVTSSQGVAASSHACTKWTGPTGVLLEVVDDPDPIQVGETTTFTLRVANQDSTRTIKQVAVAALFSGQTIPVNASAGGIVSGDSVSWPVVPALAPKQSFTCTITAKGVQAGESLLNVTVTTSDRQNSAAETESTTVY